MKKTAFIALALFLCLLLPLTGCAASRYSPSVLTVGVPDEFDRSFNYFRTANESNLLAAFLCCGSLMQPAGEGEWEPYLGKIEAEQKDGKLVATVSIGKKVRSADGQQLNIDDVLFVYSILADPGYTGPHDAFRKSSIEGVAAYYWDDAAGGGEEPDFHGQAQAKYAPDVISESDLKAYLKETSLNGEWGGNLESYRGNGQTWRQWLESEGYGKQLEKISSNAADTLELLVEHYYRNYRDRFNAVDWYEAKLRADFMKNTTADGIDVPSISGIRRVDDYTCTVTFSDPNEDYQSILYLPLIARHNYSDYYKGGGDSVAASGRKRVLYGGGPYVFRVYEDGILTLEKNKKFALGSPKNDTIRLRTALAEELPSDIELRQISIGSLPAPVDEAAADQIERYHLSHIDTADGMILYSEDIDGKLIAKCKSYQAALNLLRNVKLS